MKPFPCPHPLDFDWRYDDFTARNVAELLGRGGRILSLGAPTIARLIEAEGADVTLVDRQPAQGVHNHIVSAIEDFDCDPMFDAAIVDPPWYPQHFEAWVRVAGRTVLPGGCILLSAWPKHTRPTAASELDGLLGEFATWSTIERNAGQLVYVEPAFEAVARGVGENRPLSRSPLRGELIRLRVNKNPHAMPTRTARTIWHRFIINDYQLAIRVGKPTNPAGVRQLTAASGWLWPFVSARAAGIEDISVWSSYGEVGVVGDATAAIATLRKALKCDDVTSFERALAAMPELLEWHLPRPPYERLIEWQHRQ